MLPVIGLTGKSAIMIIEFSRERMASLGETAREAAWSAAKLRFRPILMTSLAFTLGVAPLVVSTGAGARHTIGYATLFGTFSGTVLGIFFVTRLLGRKPKAVAVQEAAEQACASPLDLRGGAFALLRKIYRGLMLQFCDRCFCFGAANRAHKGEALRVD